ncbi:MAG: hypothetical protein A3F67_08845 [Verrucomicrobia bacterium RIFCSPHIGHO2_12_FULL_41_10]|nr:MAG: hypothetical protein A3F67_08845 [Verrucomicrobia bacterium RIFCSPHIGHO2_12_FULL_41_10]
MTQKGNAPFCFSLSYKFKFKLIFGHFVTKKRESQSEVYPRYLPSSFCVFLWLFLYEKSF